MGQKWILKIGLFLIIVVSLHICNSEEIAENKDARPGESTKSFDGPFRPLMRRRIVRKRINDGESNANVTNVSMSMSVSSSRVQSESGGQAVNDEPLPSPEGLQGDGPTRRPFGKFRPSFMNRTRNFPDFKPTMEPRETPSVSFREFRLTMKPRIGFNRQKPVTSTSTTEAEEEEEDTPKPTTSMPFPPKKFLKGKPRRRTTTTTEEPVVEEENELDDQDDQTAEDDENNTVEVDPGTDEASSSTSTTQEQSTTTEASTTTTVLTTTEAPIESPAETTPRKEQKNSSMIIIPVPPSQRKPYHPVIMQVTKTPTTAESLPETRVVTYKLNKMFVPMGIYGKVLPKSASQSDLDVTTENTIVSTPLPFLLPGQESQSKKIIKSNVGKDVQTGAYLRTPTPEIKVKGHRSKEIEEPMTSGDSSNDFASAVAYASSQKEHHERQQKQWESMMQKLKQKQRNLADSVSLTYQTQRRPNIKDINLTTEKVDAAKISITTEESVNFDGSRRDPQQTPWTGNFHQMGAPRPFRPNQQPSKSILGTLTSAASSIPGLLHEGFTHLTSGYGTAFEDEARFPGPSEAPPSFVASESQTQIVTPGPDDSLESLEFFRKRPHLLQKYKNRGSKNNFLPPEYSSGFKPVTVPPYFASQYFASTPQHSTASPFVTSTITSGIKKLREPLYNKHWEPPVSSSSRDAKQFSLNDLAAWKAAMLSGHSDHQKGFSHSSTTPRASLFSSSTPKSFVDQWLEFNQKYSKNEIEDAKDKIYTMFSESRADPYDDLMYMKPPGVAASKGAGSAFDDLLKMFKMGFSVGAGHSSNKKPMISYSAGMHSDDSFQAASGDGWRPLSKSKAAGGPGVGMISFNAGVTIGGGGKPTSTPGYSNIFGGGTHYSSSSKPYVPKSTYKELSKGYALKDLRSKYHEATRVPIAPRPTPGAEYASHLYYNNFKTLDNADDGSESSKQTRFEINPAVSTHFSPNNAIGGSGKVNAGFDRSKLESVLGSMKYLNDQAIEIIPSSEFFKQKGNMADIAAVIKPPELSDELVKAALPPQISSVPQLSYPTQQLIQNPQGFTSISQLQQYFATAQPAPHPTQAYQQPQLIHPHQQFQHQIPQQQQLFFHQGGFIPQHVMHQQFQGAQLPQPTPAQQQQLQQQQHQHQLQQIQQQQHQQQQQQHQHQLQQQQHHSSQSVKAPGDSALGFSDFEIPAGVDPDIASLLRAELSKDDIPEEFRKDFIEAQEQEKAKLQQKQKQQDQQPQASASRLRITVIKPGQPQQQHASKRIDRNDNNKPEIKFHKPIPINPTMLTPTKGKPIRASPVPRYVVELARKLKTDKDVQGIVRVSTKRNRGPPIEYLYPVRG